MARPNPSSAEHAHYRSSPSSASRSQRNPQPSTGQNPGLQSAWGSNNTSSQQAPPPAPQDQPADSFVSTSTAQQAPQTNMFCPPSISYDPDQEQLQQEGEGYQRWVEAYSQGQFDYGGAGNIPQVVYPPSVPQPSIPGPVQHAQAPDQYGFMPGQFVSQASGSQENLYTQQFAQQGGSRDGNLPGLQQAAMGQGYPHSTTQMNTLAVQYTAPPQALQYAAHTQNIPSASVMQHAYQQQTQQYLPQPHAEPQYVPQQQSQPLEGSHEMPQYYFQSTPSAFIGDPNQQSHQAFTFAHYEPTTGGAEQQPRLSAPSSTYPSPDPTTLASSMSPSSRADTDDGQSHQSISGTSPQPSHPQSLQPQPQHSAASGVRLSPHSVPATAKRGRAVAGGSASKPKANLPSKRRRRSDIPVDNSESGSDDDELVASSSVLPPLKGPGSTPTRLFPLTIIHFHSGGVYALQETQDVFAAMSTYSSSTLSSSDDDGVRNAKLTSRFSKREYLLAQIRQKDAVIESLLKQLHNPYLATPLSVASYRMATSPSDQNNRNVLAWLDRLEASVRTAGKSGGAKAFGLGSRVHAEADGDQTDEGESDRGDLQDPTVVGEHEQDNDDVVGEPEAGGDLQDDSVPMGLIASLSLNQNLKKKQAKQDDEESEDDDDVGLANETYFKPGPAYDLSIRAHMIEQNTPPEILVHGLVTPNDVDNLFKIYYARLNVHVSLLDPALHTPASTFTRCPFLFTVVCAIASRYYTEKSEIYPIAMHFAKHAAANALITGWKSVELAQAYILLSVFTVPERRWEENRGWLYIGLASRLATDLNLHQVSPIKPTTERQEREMLNRVRLWLNCYNLDRSTATQYGKPNSIKEDYIIRTSASWYSQSKYNISFDIGLCAYTAMLRIVSRFHDEVFSDPTSPSGLNMSLDFLELTTTHDNYLSQFYNEWKARFTNDSDLSALSLSPLVPSDPDFELVAQIRHVHSVQTYFLCVLTGYARLVMYSFGFQQAYRRGVQGRDQVFLDKCYQYATTVVTYMVDKLAPSGYMRFSPDGHFVFATFASAFLLKLLRPEFSSLITRQQHDEIFDIIGRLIQTFSSEELAIDERHTPKLHARFLTGLLSKHRKDVSAAAKQMQQQQPPQQQSVAGGSPPSHSQSSSPDPTYAPPPPPPQQQQPPPTGGMGQSQQPMYTENNYVYADAPGPDPAQAQQQQYGEPMVEGFDDELLGALQVLKTPGYWQTMMMPGFHWADNQSRPSPSTTTMPAFHQAIPGMQPSRTAMQATGIQYS
ncbi:hypothetical protein EIP91_001854 [Steccherinum ochraceum]|uniref:Xylanolytic transcriptional activator regulatory domain-containing protein n=1 Tax=Steccherinum ochraceum TaxID=92696 RepID=A0A4R0RFM7_9APHY|nr:hypothetical protein EIP91_001854 [Steccherinum ochraceum]